jgi:hypothetical protein
VALNTETKRQKELVWKQEHKSKELQTKIYEKDKSWSNKMMSATETVKIAVVAPKVEINFGADGAVQAIPTIPRCEPDC